MRGNKRKRDPSALAASVDDGLVTSGNPIGLPVTKEGEIAQVYAKSVGEGSRHPNTHRLHPDGRYVAEGANRWLGLRSTITTQLDGSGKGGTSELANRPSPGGCHVGQPAAFVGEGLGPVGLDVLSQGEPSSAGTSLAKEAVTWLGARSALTVRSERETQGVSAETHGSDPSDAGPIIEERDLTPEDFCSLLRVAGYDVW